MREYVIGIDIGGSNIKIMVMDTTCEVLSKIMIPTEADRGYAAALERMIHAIDGIFERCGAEKKNVLSIGMGLPGMVDTGTNTARQITRLGWNGFDPSAALGEYYHAPAFLENDANINALGEYCFNPDVKADNMLFLTLGTGIGGSIIIDGRIYNGVRNMGAEIGHMTILADGRKCVCGARGCFEMYCSGSALAEETLERLDREEDGGKSCIRKLISQNNGIYDNWMLTKAVSLQDAFAALVWKDYVHYLAVGISSLMKILNPGIVVVGGGVSKAGSVLLEPLKRECRSMVMNGEQYSSITLAGLGQDSGMYGACVLAAEKAGCCLRGKKWRESDE